MYTAVKEIRKGLSLYLSPSHSFSTMVCNYGSLIFGNGIFNFEIIKISVILLPPALSVNDTTVQRIRSRTGIELA